jgi:uncharacterized coiled-coil protein SlyX
MSEERLERIEQRLAVSSAQLTGLGQAVDDTRAQLTGVEQKVTELGRRMLVLHEQLRDDIKALAPDLSPIRREFKEADAEVREDLTRRIDPIAAWIRSGGDSKP